MRIDAHVHFMVYDPHEHVWVTDELSALKRNFLPADLEPLLKGAGFDGCVAVQARQLPHENEWLLDLAQSHGCIRQLRSDAIALWDFAPVGTEVDVTA